MTWSSFILWLKAHLMRPGSFGRFAVVGGINTAVNLSTFPLLYFLFGKYVFLNLLLVLSYIFSMTFGYLMHRHVTFRSRQSFRSEIVPFLTVAITMYAVNALVLNGILYFTGTHPVLVQTAIAAALSATLMVANYTGLSRLVFKIGRAE